MQNRLLFIFFFFFFALIGMRTGHLTYYCRGYLIITTEQQRHDWNMSLRKSSHLIALCFTSLTQNNRTTLHAPLTSFIASSLDHLMTSLYLSHVIMHVLTPFLSPLHTDFLYFSPVFTFFSSFLRSLL